MNLQVGERIARFEADRQWADAWFVRTHSNDGARLERHVSEEERLRASRFRDRASAEAYLRSHGFVREVLAAYTGIRASEMSFHRSVQGKPELSEGFDGLHFSLSRSMDFVLLAVANCEVGIDIERLQAVRDAKDIADRYFHPVEREALDTSDPQEGSKRFLELWTRKEAYVKAIGVGLAYGLESFHDVMYPSLPRIFRVIDAASRYERFAIPLSVDESAAAIVVPFLPQSWISQHLEAAAFPGVIAFR